MEESKAGYETRDDKGCVPGCYGGAVSDALPGVRVPWSLLAQEGVGRDDQAFSYQPNASEDAADRLAAEDPALLAELAARSVPLDVCPTSNVRTGAAPSLRRHQAAPLRQAGVALTVNSDDPLVFDSSVTADVAILRQMLGLSWADLAGMQLTAAQHCFQPPEVRNALAARVRHGWAAVRE